MTSDMQAIEAEYDGWADVLYITVGAATPARYEEDEDGLVWRIDRAGIYYVVTVLDYNAFWSRRLASLRSKIVQTLNVTDPDLNEALSKRGPI